MAKDTAVITYNSSITESQLCQDILTEIRNCKKYFTDREKDNLDIHLFHPNDVDHCIYGMATGNCYTQRAASLIRKCSVGFGADAIYNEKFTNSISFPRQNNRVHSKLEWFISLIKVRDDMVGQEIIKYIKGERSRIPAIRKYIKVYNRPQTPQAK